MQLQLSTWSEVEAYLKVRTTILIPIGSTEQHGPSGLIGTDAICPEAILGAVGKSEGVLVGPTLPVGNAQHHLGFPGTISLRPSTLIAMVVDVIDSVAHHGFERILFVNGHGGNIAPVFSAFSEYQSTATLQRESSSRTALHNWWEGPRVMALLEELFAENDGLHGTCGEISLTQFIRPDAIKAVVTEGKGPDGEFFYDAADFRKRFPDGRMGSDPSYCSPEHGERIHEAAVKDAVEALLAFEARE